MGLVFRSVVFAEVCIWILDVNSRIFIGAKRDLGQGTPCGTQSSGSGIWGQRVD